MTRLLNTVKEMAIVVAKMEKRPVEVETPIATFEPVHVLSQPPMLEQFLHIPTSPLVVGYTRCPHQGCWEFSFSGK